MKYSFWSLILAIATICLNPESNIARELSEIKATGQLKVAVKNNSRPLGFRDPEGKLKGLEIDLARKLAAEILGDETAINLIPVSNQERLQAVLDDRVDIAIARVAVTTPRARIVSFSPYYYLDGTSILTDRIDEIKTITDLKKRKIAVLKNSTTIAVIRHKLPEAILVGVESYQEALKLMEQQQVAGFAGDRSMLVGWEQEYPNYKLLPERLSGAALAIVMPKGLQYKKLRSEINRAIAEWQKSGWLQERIDYWGLGK